MRGAQKRRHLKNALPIGTATKTWNERRLCLLTVDHPKFWLIFLHSLNRLSGICVPSLSNSLWSTANVNQERSTPTNLFLSKPWGQKETQAIQDAHSLCLSPSNLELYENGPSIFADRTVTFLLFVLVALLRLFSRHLSIITDMLHLLQMLLQPNDVQRCVVRLAIGVNAHAPNVPSDWHVASSIAQRLATEMKSIHVGLKRS